MVYPIIKMIVRMLLVTLKGLNNSGCYLKLGTTCSVLSRRQFLFRDLERISQFLSDALKS